MAPRFHRAVTRLPMLAACAACVCLAACGSGHPAQATPAWKVQAGQVRGLGTIVIDGRGFTLYIYQPDRQGPSVCTGVCAVQWPPLVLPRGVRRPAAGPGVNPALLGTDPRAGGVLQVTYNRWPLYLGRPTWRPGRLPARARTWALGTRCRSAGTSTGCRCPEPGPATSTRPSAAWSATAASPASHRWDRRATAPSGRLKFFHRTDRGSRHSALGHRLRQDADPARTAKQRRDGRRLPAHGRVLPLGLLPRGRAPVLRGRPHSGHQRG